MKTERGGDIQIQVAVVRSVESPEDRHGMVRAMDPVKHQVHDHDGRNHVGLVPQAHEVEQASLSCHHLVAPSQKDAPEQN